MERREANRRGIRVGAALQQRRGSRAMTAVRGQHQRACAVGQQIVHVGARFHQQPGRLGVAGASRKQQRRAAAFRHRIVELFPAGPLRHFTRDRLVVHARTGPHVGSALDKRDDDVRVSLGCRPHQRRLVVRALLRVDVCSLCQQRLHGFRRSGTRTVHEHRLAAQERRVRIRVRRQQLLDHGRAAVRAGQVERRDPDVVRDIHVRAGLNQQLRCIQIVQVHGPVECRRAITLRRIHVGVLFQQVEHGRFVVVLHCLDQPEVAGGGKVHSRRQQHNPGAGQASEVDTHLRTPAFS